MVTDVKAFYLSTRILEQSLVETGKYLTNFFSAVDINSYRDLRLKSIQLKDLVSSEFESINKEVFINKSNDYIKTISFYSDLEKVLNGLIKECLTICQIYENSSQLKEDDNPLIAKNREVVDSLLLDLKILMGSIAPRKQELQNNYVEINKNKNRLLENKVRLLRRISFSLLDIYDIFDSIEKGNYPNFPINKIGTLARDILKQIAELPKNELNDRFLSIQTKLESIFFISLNAYIFFGTDFTNKFDPQYFRLFLINFEEPIKKETHSIEDIIKKELSENRNVLINLFYSNDEKKEIKNNYKF